MKIVVFSDSHGMISPMRRAAELHSDADLFLHLGDGCREFEMLCEQMGIKGQDVRGNCDLADYETPAFRLLEIGGCKIFMTHGHEFSVKFTLSELISAGEREGADLILFGHTHIPLCSYEKGIHLLNPGSIGTQSDYGLIQIGRMVRGEDGRMRPEILISNANLRKG